MSCLRAILTLLPKKGDLTEIKNWRPVSLLCSDYKILSKVLANRLSKIMNEVIHPDQTYCVPKRSIFDNISLIRDIYDVSKSLNIDAGLISLDQEKAFDRVEHVYLWETLKAFGFSKKCIDIIKVLYSDVESILKVNGGLCTPFKVFRGVRQGCPLSGMLYSLAIEPFLEQVRKNVQGFSVPMFGKSISLSAYADDVLVFVNQPNDVKVLMSILDDFRKLSSAKVNLEKSEAIQIGDWKRGCFPLPPGLVWKKGGFKYLGFFLGDEVTVQKNWEGIIEKVKGRLEKWKWLIPNMSYRGRTLVINNLIASSLWHKLTCLDPPLCLLAEIQAILVNFFWDKLHWVPQSILFLPKEEGRQGLIHLQSRTAAFRLQFLQRLLSGSITSSWKVVACKILQNFGNLKLDRNLFFLDLSKLNISGMPIFYRNVLWGMFKVQREGHFKSLYWLLEEPLVHGARFDLNDDCAIPGYTEMLVTSKLCTLGSLVNLIGTDFENTEKVAISLNVKSRRFVSHLLEKWKKRLMFDELNLLSANCERKIVLNEDDVLPVFCLLPVLNDVSGMFLSSGESLCLDFFQVLESLFIKLVFLCLIRKCLTKELTHHGVVF